MGIDRMISSLFSESRIKINSICQLMLPTTIVSWSVGFGIIEYPRGEQWPIASFLYMMTLMLAYGIVVHVSIMNLDTTFSTSNQIGRLIFLSLFYVNIFLNVTCTMLAWMRAKSVKKIEKCLEECDANMEKIGISRDYRIVYIRQILCLILHFLVLTFFITVTIITWGLEDVPFWIEIAYKVAIYYPIILTSIGDFAFITLVRFVCVRFNQLNEFLLSMSTTSENSPQHKRVLDYTKFENVNVMSKRTRDDYNAMKAARICHYDLVNVSSDINDTFGIQILLSMTVSFVLMTGLLYNACSLFLWSKPSQEAITAESLHLIGWIVYYTAKIIVVNSSCASASAAAKKTGYIVCHLHEPSTKKAFRDEIRDFTLQMTHHSLSFSACGFFNLNYEFIQAMISSITTYLIILLQIGEIGPDENFLNSTIASA